VPEPTQAEVKEAIAQLDTLGSRGSFDWVKDLKCLRIVCAAAEQSIGAAPLHSEFVRACIHAAIPDSLLPQLRDSELGIMAERITKRLNAKLASPFSAVKPPTVDYEIEIALLRGRLHTIHLAYTFGEGNYEVAKRLAELENTSDQARQYVQNAQTREHRIAELETTLAVKPPSVVSDQQVKELLAFAWTLFNKPLWEARQQMHDYLAGTFAVASESAQREEGK
jgi:hypothetical protein